MAQIVKLSQLAPVSPEHHILKINKMLLYLICILIYSEHQQIPVLSHAI